MGKIEMWIEIGQSNSKRKQKRLNKGMSLLELIDDYTVLDVETTGVDPRVDRIIQVSCLTVRNGEINNKFDTYINPGIEINSFISTFTGITNEMVSSAPTIEEISKRLFEYIGDDIIVGHNVNFDINFIYDAFISSLQIGLSNNFIDTLRMARRLFPEWHDHQLRTLVTNFNFPAEIFHNSLEDAIHTYCCYEYMKKLIKEDQVDKYHLSTVPKRENYRNLYAKDITATRFDFDPEDPCYGKTFVFTGTLERMDRRDAMQIVVNHGGQCADNINKTVNYLVVGDYSKSWGVKDGKTGKLKKAENLILAGQDLQIISEDVFFGMLEDYENLKQYTN